MCCLSFFDLLFSNSSSGSFWVYPFLPLNIVIRLTRRVPLVEQEPLTLSEHMSSPPVFSWVRVTRSLVLCVCFVHRCLSFSFFLLAIVLSVLLRFTDSDYSFCIFKLFLFTITLFLVLWALSTDKTHFQWVDEFHRKFFLHNAHIFHRCWEYINMFA
jgi:hypothetical protein